MRNEKEKLNFSDLYCTSLEESGLIVLLMEGHKYIAVISVNIFNYGSVGAASGVRQSPPPHSIVSLTGEEKRPGVHVPVNPSPTSTQTQQPVSCIYLCACMGCKEDSSVRKVLSAVYLIDHSSQVEM